MKAEAGDPVVRLSTTVGMVIIAVLSPLLGTIADFNGRKKRMLGGFMLLGVASVAAMFFIYQGDWILASVLFILANIGANGSFVFYDALLPHIARDDEVDRVSTAGYALGYIGGGVLLALNLAWIIKPRVVRAPRRARTCRRRRPRCPAGWRSCRSRSGGWSSRSRSSAAFRSRRPPACRPDTRRAGLADPGRHRSADRDRAFPAADIARRS